MTASFVNQDYLEIRDLTVDFDGFKAVNGVDVTFLQGRLHFLIGPNGAGKTTLVDALTGLVHGSGEAKFQGQNLLDMKSRCLWSLANCEAQRVAGRLSSERLNPFSEIELTFSDIGNSPQAALSFFCPFCSRILSKEEPPSSFGGEQNPEPLEKEGSVEHHLWRRVCNGATSLESR